MEILVLNETSLPVQSAEDTGSSPSIEEGSMSGGMATTQVYSAGPMEQETEVSSQWVQERVELQPRTYAHGMQMAFGREKLKSCQKNKH